MKYKFLVIFLLTFVLYACTGAGGKRSEKSDEFLIEKKNPLVMPPDIDDLPKPKENLEADKSEDDFEKTLKSKRTSTSNATIDQSSSLQESIIKKIEQ